MRLTVSLFSARTDLLCTLDLAQDIELKRKNVLHGSGARFLSAVHTGLLIMEAQVGQLQAQLAQTQAELQYAIEQIRILTIHSEQQRIGSRISGYSYSTEYDNSTSRRPNRFPLSNAQSELPVRQGHHSEHLRRQAENRFPGMGRNFSFVSINTMC